MTTGAAQQIKAEYERALRLAQAGQTREAAAILDALALKVPTAPEIPFKRAQLAAKTGDVETWCRAIDKAYALRPTEPAILEDALHAHRAAGNSSRVLDLINAKIARDPKAIGPQADKALYLQQIGDFDASEKLFRKLLKKHPNEAELYRMFAATIRFKPNDPLIGAMRRLAKHPQLSPQGQMHVNYALAKAMEDTKQADRVFPHLRRANSAQAALWPDDPKARAQEWRAVVDAQEGLSPLSDSPGTAPDLIFVTGLPRSGTTLVEQIIASHSSVQAGGELATALRTAYACFGAGADMAKLTSRPSKDLHAFASRLEMQNRIKRDLTRPWLTDKSIMAFLIYGLLYATLPNARFIVVHRDPRDIAVSIYKNYFNGGTHRYANDLATIAETIKLFRQIVGHWRETLPDRFSEVRYEDLVSDPEEQSRRLIAAAGLDWEDQCLNFHQNTGAVKTLSLHQVRQPIYQSSAAAWRRYETELQPFFDAWGDTPWD
ncbi:tetratricopeptide repeat-containing sulfotransferase family protein [uncultured Marivita sp.]|uniref:tetratricopeptide repeat-containing sulfotransferase family protein n=1 Tax=uncultured Marivita sp. TaxID=888080 RepID=UPI002637CF9D|nr:tetratricopeptide repeat-containing sulfotransferase family protein [uncultured Marivita sp.]